MFSFDKLKVFSMYQNRSLSIALRQMKDGKWNLGVTLAINMLPILEKVNLKH